jgi:pimeloyl-ACP methyl ester carboxylesterase
LALLALLVVALGGFVIWANTAPAPMPQALAALQSNDQVQVQSEPWLTFRPVGAEPSTGLVIYPGGRTDPRAYAPIAQAIAAQGFQVTIVPMPLNLAFFAPDRAQQVITAFPMIHHWAIGGHSLGGAMAARFAYSQPEAVQGLVLWAAYPADSDDLSRRNLRVVSIYGTQDGLATSDQIDASRALLPPTTRWVAIESGNHAQFGDYGPQPGDRDATIARETQQAEMIRATLDLLEQLGD